jgi:hypothetical protein
MVNYTGSLNLYYPKTLHTKGFVRKLAKTLMALSDEFAFLLFFFFLPPPLNYLAGPLHLK